MFSAIVMDVDNDAISVRLVEWNVAMSLHDKSQLLAKLNPTVAVLPESAHPDRTRAALEAIGASSMQWIGGNPNKGLLAVAFDGWDLQFRPSSWINGLSGGRSLAQQGKPPADRVKPVQSSATDRQSDDVQPPCEVLATHLAVG